jgi:class 3 adenylate cyclase
VDIADWVRALGLEKYGPAFQEHATNWDMLSELTPDDLNEIGVAGGRRSAMAAGGDSRSRRGSPAAPGPERSSVAAEAERRQLTVMFCDLVGSTPL